MIATEQPSIAMIERDNPQGFASSVSSIVIEVIQISGRVMDDADKLFLIEKTKEELLNEYRYLTGTEIRYAFAQGVRGRYGDYYYINLPTFIKWLDKYLDSEERQRVINNKTKKISVDHQLAKSNNWSDEDLASLYRQRANYNYSLYIDTGKIEVTEIISLRKIFENFIFLQMRKDGKVKKEEKTILDVFSRYKNEGKKVIYENY